MSSLVVARLPSLLDVARLRLLTISSASELMSPPAFYHLITGLHLLQLLAITGYQLKLRVKVKVTLRLAVHRQSFHLGARPFEIHDQSFFIDLLR
jgi:hypothetical protein